MQIKKRIQNRSIRLYKAAMMIKDYNISKVKYKWSILMSTWIKIKLSIIKSGHIFQIIQAFIEYSNDIQDVYKNIDKYNVERERKILIVFADMINNKELISIVTELFIRGRKLNISLVFVTQSDFKIPKEMLDWILLTFLLWKFRVKENFNKNLSDINTKDFNKIHKNVLLNHILLKLMMLLLHQIIL